MANMNNHRLLRQQHMLMNGLTANGAGNPGIAPESQQFARAFMPNRMHVGVSGNQQNPGIAGFAGANSHMRNSMYPQMQQVRIPVELSKAYLIYFSIATTSSSPTTSPDPPPTATATGGCTATSTGKPRCERTGCWPEYEHATTAGHHTCECYCSVRSWPTTQPCGYNVCTSTGSTTATVKATHTPV